MLFHSFIIENFNYGKYKQNINSLEFSAAHKGMYLSHGRTVCTMKEAQLHQLQSDPFHATLFNKDINRFKLTILYMVIPYRKTYLICPNAYRLCNKQKQATIMSCA